MINAASGYPQLSGTIVPNAVWSGKLLVKFYDSTVFGEIANTDYEGEIKKMGDRVIIRTLPTITIRDYVKGQELDDETPDPENVELVIDRAKYWNFVVDDIDRFQSDLEFVDDWSRDASEQMKINTDTTILGNVYADADSTNSGATAGRISDDINLGVTGSPVTLTKTNILEYIVDLGTCLDENNVPENERYIVLPAWACGMIKKSDLKDASLSGDETSIMRNGRLGMIDRFTVYRSNLLARSGANNIEFNIIAGQRHAISFAAQFTKNEILRSEHTFGDKARGLMVYGFEVLKPTALCHGVVRK